MYIPEFWFGVIVGILFEAFGLVAAVLFFSKKEGNQDETAEEVEKRI